MNTKNIITYLSIKQVDFIFMVVYYLIIINISTFLVQK